MPILGADMEAGTLVAWRKHPGDHVARGDILAEVETDKGLIEVEVFTTGTLERILIDAGAKVPVGTVLATIREDAGAAITTERARVSPAARRRAEELGVDPATLAGTGPGGAVTREDVEHAAPAAPRPPSAARMRQAIGAAMSRSKREIPHFYLATTIPLRRTLDWLARENAARPVTERLLPGVVFLKAVALALREFPELNARWTGTGASPSPGIHVGTAVALRGGGLVAPAIHDTDRVPLRDLMVRLRNLVARARAGTLRSSELSDGTITVTSLGDQGVEQVTGVIFPPQVAIVGFGTIVERPWVEGDRVVPAPVVTASLSADHRVTDGHRAARFLAAVAHLLQDPEALA